MRYRNEKTFLGHDGIHLAGRVFSRKQGDPIDAWKTRGLIRHVTDPEPDVKPKGGPTVVGIGDGNPTEKQVSGPDQTNGTQESAKNEMPEEASGQLTGVQMSYKCGDCDAVFSTRAALNGHMAVHRRKRG